MTPALQASGHPELRICPRGPPFRFSDRLAFADEQPLRTNDRTGDRSELMDEIVQALEERGLPPGAWLMDVARVRKSLQEADALLRRLEDAIIRAAETAPLDER